MAVPQTKPLGKLAAARGALFGLASRLCDFAGVADMATADIPASFAKRRRENLPGIGSPSGSWLNCFDKRKPVGMEP